MSAALLEAFASESYRQVSPAYFEHALKIKYSRDNESAQIKLDETIAVLRELP